MKYKKIILLLVLLLGIISVNFIISVPDVLAVDKDNGETFQLPFKPAISIPGFYEAGQEINISGASLANYIKAVYRYGGIFAGIVAMFMLVYAGWEWLLAGGNSSKISQAKSKISATLVGLVILFGGYLLLSLISKNLISFEPLTTTLDDIPCTLYKTESTCPVSKCHWTPDIFPTVANEAACVDGAATAPEMAQLDCMQVNFPLWAGDLVIRNCAAYPDVASCNTNACFGKDYKYSDVAGGPLNEVCVVKGDQCGNLRHKTCSNNSDCEIENNPDAREWCCWDQNLAADYCRPIGGPAGIDESDCNN